MTKRTWICATLAAALWTHVAVAAQPTAADRKQAKAQFILGQKAFEQHDFHTALSHFQKAFKLHPHDAVRFNMAVCLEKLGRFRDAVRQYRAAAKSDQLDDNQKRRAEVEAETASQALGTLKVEGTPAGAAVLVDGEQLCNVPCSVQLDPEEHRIVVRSGAREDSRRVLISRQKSSTVTVALAPAPANTAPLPEPRARTRGVHHKVPHDVRRRGPGWLTWSGAGLVAVGTAGTVVFGLQATSAHDDFVKTGSQDARTRGIRDRTLTNVSIGVLVVGAVVAGVDLLFFAPEPKSTPSATRRWRGVELTF